MASPARMAAKAKAAQEETAKGVEALREEISALHESVDALHRKLDLLLNEQQPKKGKRTTSTPDDQPDGQGESTASEQPDQQ